jgi:hypothetical protein
MQNTKDIAVLSWRWDVDPHTNSSRNAYVACQEAKRQGVRYLLLDKVTVNQDQADEDMLIERLAFAQLYREIPVIAAYDDANPRFAELTAEVHGALVSLGSPFSRIMRRPWIFHEVDLYRSNPTKVTYVGYIRGLGCDEEDGFLVYGTTDVGRDVNSDNLVHPGGYCEHASCRGFPLHNATLF